MPQEAVLICLKQGLVWHAVVPRVSQQQQLSIYPLLMRQPVTLFRSLCPLTEGDRQPPRPPLPQYYGSTERPPAVPPLPSPSGTRPPPHTSKHGQRNGTHSSVRHADPSRLTHPCPCASSSLLALKHRSRICLTSPNSNLNL